MRQLRRRRLSATKNVSPESVGRVVPALKDVLPCDCLGTKRFGDVTPYLACGYQLHEGEGGGGKRWKRASCSTSSKRTSGWPLCEKSQAGEGTAYATGCKNLKM